MAQVHFHVDGGDETFVLEVDPPPQVGARFGNDQRTFEVLTIGVTEGGHPDQFEATLKTVDPA
jgi:hypothetical protein